jgi:RecG-like helicase
VPALSGARRSGLHAFRVATLPDDLELLERAWMRARTFLDEAPALGAPVQALLEGRPGGRLRPRGARAVPD